MKLKQPRKEEGVSHPARRGKYAEAFLIGSSLPHVRYDLLSELICEIMNLIRRINVSVHRRLPAEFPIRSMIHAQNLADYSKTKYRIYVIKIVYLDWRNILDPSVDFIKNEFLANNISLTDKQASQFKEYYEMLIETNTVMNLTAVTEFEDVVRKHFIDSIMVGRVLDVEKIRSVVDIGTGAGFTGLPLKIVYPQFSLTLVDSLGKRVRFLQTVVDRLELTDTVAVHSRSEDLARNKKYREKFDLCTARAVAAMNVLSEYCLPYVKEGGYFSAYKSGNIAEEIENAGKAITVLGGKIENADIFDFYDMKRSIVLVKKIKKTPAKYPRKAGLPSRNPIGSEN